MERDVGRASQASVAPPVPLHRPLVFSAGRLEAWAHGTHFLRRIPIHVIFRYVKNILGSR